jgi:hypothetical protein
MPLRKTLAAVAAATLLIGGCSYSDDTLWPSLTGGDPSGNPGTQAAPAAPGPADAATGTGAVTTASAPPLGTTLYQPVPISSAEPTGTFVGQKIIEMRNQLVVLQQTIATHNAQVQQLRQETATASDRYHSLVAAITSRLQAGTTPGNPILTNQWNQAQNELDRMSSQVGRMNAESNAVASDSSMAAYILESARAAYGLSGAVDEDHRQLGVLEDEVNKTVVSIDRLLNELASDVSRQTNYIARERANMTTLSVAVKNGDMYGQSLSNRAYTTVPVTAMQQSGPTARRPLVVIRFDNPNVEYEQALYTALKGALDRKPDAVFDLVAISPTKGGAGQSAVKSTTTKRHADQVLRSMSNMGLPGSRVTTSQTSSDTLDATEIQIYVR